jgi:predicted O-linked N-acetylglucosamine transferase (SPINDLY family)
VLTCVGETFISRSTGSLLHADSLPELVTHSLGEYEATALRLARPSDELAGLRARLVTTRDTCLLFDSVRYTRLLERGNELMWEAGPRDTWGPDAAPLVVDPLPA